MGARERPQLSDLMDPVSVNGLSFAFTLTCDNSAIHKHSSNVACAKLFRWIASRSTDDKNIVIP